MNKMIFFCKFILNLKFLLLVKFQCVSFLHTSFEVGLFLIFNFDIIMPCFLNPHVNLFMHDKDNVIISNFHYESIFLKNSSIILKMILTKVYCNIDNLKIENVNVEYDFTF
jgi:hypothetical protein